MSDEEMEEYGGGGAEEEVDDIDEVRVRIRRWLGKLPPPMKLASSPC